MERKKVTKDIKLVFFLDQTTPNCQITFDRNCEANLCLILKGLNFKIVALQ